MLSPAAHVVIQELYVRGVQWRPAPRPLDLPGLPRILLLVDPASIRVLSERSTQESSAVALTVKDVDGDCYLVIRHLTREAGEWRTCCGSEGVDQPVAGKSGPYAALSAVAHDGRFFAGGRVESGERDVVRVRLVWEDGYDLEDKVENGIVLFLGVRDSLNSAVTEFLDPAGRMVGRRPAFVDQR